MTNTIEVDETVTAAESLLPPIQEGQDVAVREEGAPSAFRIEQAVSIFQAARSRLLEQDTDLARDEAALADLLGDETGDVEIIVARVLRAARHAKAMADSASELIEDMQARKTRFTNRNDTLRGTAFAIMEVLGRKKIELPDLSASIRSVPAKTIITDEEAIPDIYVRIERKPDRATILSALKAGITVEGAELSNPAFTLSIRTK